MAALNKFQDRFNLYLQNKNILPPVETVHTPIKKKENIDQQSSRFSFDSSKLTIQNYSNQQISSIDKIQSQKHNRLKRLKKGTNIQDNTCAICLQQVSNNCKLQCNHQFCYQCLVGWLKCSNKCPYCRKQSTSYKNKGENYKIDKKQQTQQQYEQIDIEYNVQCYQCLNVQQGDILLVCDRCQGYSCHVNCDQSLHGVMPEEEEPWFCHFCR